MKEREIREQIERVLRTMTVSATLGVTMLAGCGSSGSVAVYEAVMPDSPVGSQPPGQDAAADFFSAVPLYMASMPDAQAADMAAPDATIDDSSDDVVDQS
jgi:predicted small lipoprotein YifL